MAEAAMRAHGAEAVAAQHPPKAAAKERFQPADTIIVLPRPGAPGRSLKDEVASLEELPNRGGDPLRMDRWKVKIKPEQAVTFNGAKTVACLVGCKGHTGCAVTWRIVREPGTDQLVVQQHGRPHAAQEPAENMK